MHVALAARDALDGREHHFVVLERLGVVEGDNIGGAAPVGEARCACAKPHPAGVVPPGAVDIRTPDLPGLGIPLPDVVIGARGERERIEHLRLRQRERESRPPAGGVQILGAGVAVDHIGHALAQGRATGRWRNHAGRSHPGERRTIGDAVGQHRLARGKVVDANRARLGCEQRAHVGGRRHECERELRILKHEAARIGIGRVGCIDQTVAIAVGEVAPANACKGA